MKYYYCVLVFINIICNNAFILTHNIQLTSKAKLYKNTRSTILMSNITNDSNHINDNDDSNHINDSNDINDSNSKSFYEFIKQRNITLNVDVEENHIKKNDVDENYVENYKRNYSTKSYQELNKIILSKKVNILILYSIIIFMCIITNSIFQICFTISYEYFILIFQKISLMKKHSRIY